MGCSVINRRDSMQTASSVCTCDGHGTGHKQGKLDSPQPWSPDAPQVDEWYQIDFGTTITVSGVVAQGRANFGQWVASYKVDVKLDGADWSLVEQEAAFTVNAGRSNRVTSIFRVGIHARYALTWSNWPSLRVGILASRAPGCTVVNPDDSMRIAWSVCVGDARGTGHNQA